MVIPYAPGGSPDIAQQTLEGKNIQVLGQPLVVLFKPVQEGRRHYFLWLAAKPDGYIFWLEARLL